MKGPEAKIKDEIKKYLKSIGAYQFWPVQTGYGQATVDCLACINGHFVAIEVKAPGKQPTTRQYLTLDAVAKSSGSALWADSMDDFMKKLRMRGLA